MKFSKPFLKRALPRLWPLQKLCAKYHLHPFGVFGWMNEWYLTFIKILYYVKVGVCNRFKRCDQYYYKLFKQEPASLWITLNKTVRGDIRHAPVTGIHRVALYNRRCVTGAAIIQTNWPRHYAGRAALITRYRYACHWTDVMITLSCKTSMALWLQELALPPRLRSANVIAGCSITSFKKG